MNKPKLFGRKASEERGRFDLLVNHGIFRINPSHNGIIVSNARKRVGNGNRGLSFSGDFHDGKDDSGEESNGPFLEMGYESQGTKICRSRVKEGTARVHEITRRLIGSCWSLEKCPVTSLKRWSELQYISFSSRVTKNILNCECQYHLVQ